MGIGLTLSIAGVMALASAFSGAKAVKSTSAVSDMSDASEVLSNSKAFTDKYLSDDVLNVDSVEPYISSAEIVRPELGGNKDDKLGGNKGRNKGLLGGLAWFTAGTVAGSSSSNRLWLFVGLLVGGYIVYKVAE